jgi:hypothetical protein
MRRLVVALLALLVIGTLPASSSAGTSEEYSYESRSMSAQFRQREGRLRIRGYVEGSMYSQSTGETGSFAGINVYVRGRGLNLHCWSYDENPTTFEISASGRSGSVSDSGSLRCHTHSSPSRRGRGTMEFAATFVGEHISSSGRSVYESDGLRCTDRYTTREGPGTAAVSFAVPNFDVDLSLTFDPIESYVSKSEGACKAVGK